MSGRRSEKGSIKIYVWARDKGSCQKCGAEGSDVHHIIPLGQGGSDTPKNCILLCWLCHIFVPEFTTFKKFIRYIKTGQNPLQDASIKGIRLYQMFNHWSKTEYNKEENKKIINFLSVSLWKFNICIEFSAQFHWLNGEPSEIEEQLRKLDLTEKCVFLFNQRVLPNGKKVTLRNIGTYIGIDHKTVSSHLQKSKGIIVEAI